MDTHDEQKSKLKLNDDDLLNNAMCIRKIDWKDRPFQDKLQMIANCLRVT